LSDEESRGAGASSIQPGASWRSVEIGAEMSTHRRHFHTARQPRLNRFPIGAIERFRRRALPSGDIYCLRAGDDAGSGVMRNIIGHRSQKTKIVTPRRLDSLLEQYSPASQRDLRFPGRMRRRQTQAGGLACRFANFGCSSSCATRSRGVVASDSAGHERPIPEMAIVRYGCNLIRGSPNTLDALPRRCPLGLRRGTACGLQPSWKLKWRRPKKALDPTERSAPVVAL